MKDSLAWCECDGRLVFLDVRADRYFQLSADRETAFRQTLDSSGETSPHQLSMFPGTAAWRAPTQASQAIANGSFNLADIAASLWWQRRVERRLATGSLHQTLLALRDAQRGAVTGEQSSEEFRRTVRAFEHARMLRTAADRCLPRSIALALRLVRHGFAAQLVIGVRTNPFGAHSWTQHEGAVLNDSVEEVLRFTPILIV